MKKILNVLFALIITLSFIPNVNAEIIKPDEFNENAPGYEISSSKENDNQETNSYKWNVDSAASSIDGALTFNPSENKITLEEQWDGVRSLSYIAGLAGIPGEGGWHNYVPDNTEPEVVLSGGTYDAKWVSFLKALPTDIHAGDYRDVTKVTFSGTGTLKMHKISNASNDPLNNTSLKEWADAYVITDLNKYVLKWGIVISSDVISQEELQQIDNQWYEEELVNQKTSVESENGVIFESDMPFEKDSVLLAEDLTSTISQEEKAKIEGNGKTLIGLYDIKVAIYETGEYNEIPMHDGHYTIKIKLTDDMKKYGSLIVGYVKDGKIEETFDTKIEGDYLVFTTTHLSQYGIFGIDEVNTPQTYDNILYYTIIMIIGIFGIALTTYNLKKRNI